MSAAGEIAGALAPALERVAGDLLTIVARLVTNRDTARALLDAAYATMEADVDELEILKLAAVDAMKNRPK
jgi:hypothetical protein